MTKQQLKKFLQEVETKRLALNQPISAVMRKAAVSCRSWYEWKRSANYPRKFGQVWNRGAVTPNPYQAMKIDAALSRLTKREKPLAGRGK